MQYVEHIQKYLDTVKPLSFLVGEFDLIDLGCIWLNVDGFVSSYDSNNPA